jgi:UDP-N-acetylglucosamine 4,6-dehydratase
VLNGSRILITGGTGSFGRAFVRIVLDRYKPEKLIVFSRDEVKQLDMRQTFEERGHSNLRFFIGDVREKERLLRAFGDVDIVIHAAALKQVPSCEYNPFEAIKTNILGAQNIIEASIDRGIKKVIALSTDKAANPINLYGATKLCSDKLFIAGNTYASHSDTVFSVVRYGNVVGSRGSVIPIFLRGREKGILPITDPKMTRFWITLPQSVEFVLSCLKDMRGGELFVPKLPSMNIMDLAKAIGPECKTEVIGIRPGEKRHEVLIPSDEARNIREFDHFYLLRSEFPYWEDRSRWKEGAAVSDDFEYQSGNNPWCLSEEEIREILMGEDGLGGDYT